MFDSINWSTFLTRQFWFGIDRFNGVSLIDKIILWFGVALLVFGIAVLVYRIVSINTLIKPMLGRVSSIFITLGLVEMFWFLLRSQFVNTLGTRFSALLVAIIAFGFLIKPLKYFLREYRQDLIRFHKEQLKQKYLKQ